MTSLEWLIPMGALMAGIPLGWAFSRAAASRKAAPDSATTARADDANPRWMAMYALANGSRDRAAFILEQHVETARNYHPDDWVMLLDIHHGSGHRDRFDALGQKYADRSGTAAPTFNDWKQLYPDGSGLNRRHPKLLELFGGLPDREAQRKFLANLTADSNRPGRPAFTLAEAEELLKLRARLNPKPTPSLTLTQSRTLTPNTAAAPEPPPPPPSPETRLRPSSSLGRTGSQPARVAAPPEAAGDTRCALERSFQRIADKIAETWPRAECARYVDSLLVDERGGRQGFPPEVVSELFLLHALLDEHRSTPRDRWEGSAR
jgi:hypothetical protein